MDNNGSTEVPKKCSCPSRSVYGQLWSPLPLRGDPTVVILIDQLIIRELYIYDIFWITLNKISFLTYFVV